MRGERMTNILHIADYGGSYSGNFIASLLRLQEALAEQFDLGMVLVFSKVAEGRPWLKLVQEQKIPVYFADKRIAVSLRALAKRHVKSKMRVRIPEVGIRKDWEVLRCEMNP